MNTVACRIKEVKLLESSGKTDNAFEPSAGGGGDKTFPRGCTWDAEDRRAGRGGVHSGGGSSPGTRRRVGIGEREEGLAGEGDTDLRIADPEVGDCKSDEARVALWDDEGGEEDERMTSEVDAEVKVGFKVGRREGVAALGVTGVLEVTSRDRRGNTPVEEPSEMK